MDLLTWAAGVDLTDLIKYEYLAQFTLVVALLTSFPNKPVWVRMKILYSVLFFFLYWGARIVLSNAARQYDGSGGLDLAGVFSNHVIIVTLNSVLIFHLGGRFIKIACLIDYKIKRAARLGAAGKGHHNGNSTVS